MVNTATVIGTSHTVTRLEIPTGLPFQAFRDAFEAAAPVFDSAAVAAITERGGSWNEVLAAVAANAPHGLMVFMSLDIAPLMAAAGHHRPAVEYLLGNHTIAERMYRHSPLAVLYAPLRVLVFADERGEAVFALDQPSTLFGSLADPRITEVGHELDAKVAALLAAIGVDVGAALSPGEPN
jgi:uncharacterized protein (DUF302 family)